MGFTRKKKVWNVIFKLLEKGFQYAVSLRAFGISAYALGPGMGQLDRNLKDMEEKKTMN